MKTCYICGETKPLAAYHNSKNAKDGKVNRCKDCVRLYQQERRQRPEVKEHAQEYFREWAAAHPGYSTVQTRRWRSDNPERAKVIYTRQNRREYTKARKQRWHESPKGRETKRKYVEGHKDQVRATIRAHYFRFAHVYKAHARIWKNAHPDRLRQYSQIRFARKRANGGRFTAKEWRALCARFGGKCARCGAQAKLSVDHVIPVSLGGTNDISNIQPLCISCNSSKGAKVVDFRV